MSQAGAVWPVDMHSLSSLQCNGLMVELKVELRPPGVRVTPRMSVNDLGD